MIAAGAALTAVAVLANVYLFQHVGQRRLVIQIARDVPVGARIGRADLGTASVALDSGLGSISGSELLQVVGRRAAVDLRHGTLLTVSQVTTALSPQPGQALVTTGIKADQLPPQGLAPGSKVRLVLTNQQGVTGAQSGADDGAATQIGTTPSSDAAAGKDVSAVVDAVGGPDADGSMTVSLLVADADSSTLAREAAAGRIAVVVTARGG
ncbi:hypothetical protein GCM10027176_51730 [Actinoallomurus bryophytorum]|nr:SAF domain-containing protein [Actinoallomurus bryophytorum]